MEVILKLLGEWRDNAGRIVSVRPSYHSDVPVWLVLLIAVALVGLTFWLYRQTAQYVTPRRRIALTVLRSTFLVMLLALVLHPVLVVTTAGAVRQTLVMLVDTSGSMGIEELRTEEADVKRAAIARGELDPKGGLRQEYKAKREVRVERIELAKAALKDPKLNLVAGLEAQYELAPFKFDRAVEEIALAKPAPRKEASTGQAGFSLAVAVALLAMVGGAILAAFMKPRMIGAVVAGAGVAVFAVSVMMLMYLDRKKSVAESRPEAISDRTAWVNTISKAEGGSTALGDAVQDAIYRKLGQSLAGLVLVTDGVNNSGSSASDAADFAKARGLPLYIWGVGITSPKDLIVSGLFVQDVVFVRDEVPVTVRVQAQGLKGQTARVVLRQGEKQVDEKEISLDEEEQAVNLKFNPQDVGEFDVTASVEPRSDEVIRDNNTATRHVRVIDGRIKVLQIEQLPRWEFKYIQAMLMRDRRVEYKCVLLEADAAVTEIPDTPYLKQVPTRVGDLANYDLVILGDVDPKRLSPAFMDALSEFVSRAGGSVIMIAGKKYSPVAYRKTPIEKMLPVEFDAPTVEIVTQAASDKPIRLELDDAGKASPMLRLADKEAESLSRWAQLPPIYWTARIARPKPAAQVLVVDADPAKSSRYGKMPVIALQQYGLGQVLYVGTDNTWRWRKNLHEQDHTRLWGQMIERMALPHMLGASKRTQLHTDRQVYGTGDRVTVFARLYKEKDFEPVTEPVVKATYAPKDAAVAAAEGSREVILRALPDQPGMYRAEFVASKAGQYRLKVETDASTSLDFVVTNQTLELTQTAMNERMLREMAAQTGGAFFREEDLHAMPAMVKQSAKERLSTIPVEFGFSPLYFMLMLGVVTAEWIVRKLSQLK